MSASDAKLALDHERRFLARDGERLETLEDVTRVSSLDGGYHVVTFSSLTPVTADAVIGREIEHFRQKGVGFEWNVYAHDQPADLRDRLARHGFRVGPREAVLVYDLAAGAGGILAWLQPSVARVDRLDQVADFRRVAEGVFAKDYTFTANQLSAAIAAGSTQHRAYVAYADGNPVSIGRLYTHPQSWFGDLHGGGTLRGHRGQGFYRAVVASRARDAIELGAKYLLVDALPTSRPILERLGFQWLTDTWPCEWNPSNPTAGAL